LKGKIMAEAKRIIVGIACDIIDDNTGAPASFHTVSGVHLDLSNQYYTVTLDSYFNQKMYESGKRSMGSSQIQMDSPPPRGQDVIDWALQAIVAPSETPDDFTGAELVYRELPQEEAAA
jgi:hypothetical protein